MGFSDTFLGWVRMLHEGLTQEDEDYVDNVNVVLEKPEEMLVVDEIFQQFESFSGAILNRSEKTKLMGIGQYQGYQQWPLNWIKV